MTDTLTEAPRRLHAGVLFGLAGAWLVGAVWAAGTALGGQSLDVMISTVAHSLYSVVNACLGIGAGAGLFVLTRFAWARAGSSPTRRLVVGAIVGAAIGIVLGTALLVLFGTGAIELALTVAVAALVGGLATALPPHVFGAALAGMLGGVAVAVLLSLFNVPLKKVLGADGTIEGQLNAETLFTQLSALLQGVAAALVAYQYLRRVSGNTAWPWYFVAGCSAGVAGLATIALSRTGGAVVYRAVAGLSELDAFSISFSLEGSLNGALIAAFVGGLGALILVGRTIKRPAT